MSVHVTTECSLICVLRISSVTLLIITYICGLYYLYLCNCVSVLHADVFGNSYWKLHRIMTSGKPMAGTSKVALASVVRHRPTADGFLYLRTLINNKHVASHNFGGTGQGNLGWSKEQIFGEGAAAYVTMHIVK